MADCNDLFKIFHITIELTEARLKRLKKSRNAIREKIRDHFKTLEDHPIKPKFNSQGSMVTETIVNPIPRYDSEGNKLLKYDVDDGVYFIDKEGDEERKALTEYQDQIAKAVENHTNTPPLKKKSCVRVIFSDGHHIDLPVYFKRPSDPKPNQQHGSRLDNWNDSDPLEFIEWFQRKADKNRLRHIVRYIKAWADKQNFDEGKDWMPCGLILTILATNNFVSNDRDDVSLKETMVEIKSALDRSFKCYRPTTPINEDLLEGYAYEGKFLKALGTFIETATKALKEENQKKACELWQELFGDRFSCSTAKDESKSEYGAVYTKSLESKPYHEF